MNRIKLALRWLGVGAGAMITFIIALFIAKEEGKREGKESAEDKAQIDKVAEAGKKGDAGESTIDDVWRRDRS